jgi:serine phosphatase RsbU (regulator of sigma subunit)
MVTILPVRDRPLRFGWLVLACFVTLMTVLAFGQLVGGRMELLFDQGPLALNPTIYDQLRLLFPVDLITGVQLLVHAGGAVVFGVVAFLVAGRRLSGAIRLLSSAMLLTLGASLFAPLTLLAQRHRVWSGLVAVLGVFSPTDPRLWRSLTGVLLVAFAVLFPTGALRDRWSTALAAFFVVVVAGWTLAPRSFLAVDAWPAAGQRLWSLGLPIALAAILVSRQIRSDPGERERGRLVTIAWVAVVGVFALLWVVRPELGGDAFGLILATPRMRAIYDLNLLGLLTVAVFLLPVSVFVSVVRYRLFDIDLLVNQALVFGLISAVAAAVFLAVGLVVGFVLPERGLLGLAAGPAGLVTGVLMVGLFQPLRRAVQRSVDRRFFADKYAAENAIAAFSVRAEDAIDPEVLRADLAGVAKSILRAERAVVVNLRPPDPSVAVDLLTAGPDYLHLANDGWVMAAPVPVQAGEPVTLLVSWRESMRSYSALDQRLMEELGRAAGPGLRVAELVHRQAEAAREKQRVDQELSMARRIQLDLLPKRMPSVLGWDIDVHYQPAREVGGDFYDLVELGGGILLVVVGDVADKGVPAAMVMATTRTLLRGSAHLAAGPGDLLARINEQLVPDTPAAMFVTCLCMFIDTNVGGVRMANAGHPLPYLRSPQGVGELRARGMPLGLFPGMEYEEVEAVISTGSAMVLFSDGLVEAHGPEGDMLGWKRVADRLASMSGPLVAGLLEELAVFTTPAWEQEDDVTLMVITRHDRNDVETPV